MRSNKEWGCRSHAVITDTHRWWFLSQVRESTSTENGPISLFETELEMSVFNGEHCKKERRMGYFVLNMGRCFLSFMCIYTAFEVGTKQSTKECAVYLNKAVSQAG